MLLTEIDHVAIAVNDLDAAIAWYEEVFGATVEHREVVDSDALLAWYTRVGKVDENVRDLEKKEKGVIRGPK